VLANKHFEKWLMELDVEGWRETFSKSA
jgi:hypothetical protein